MYPLVLVVASIVPVYILAEQRWWPRWRIGRSRLMTAIFALLTTGMLFVGFVGVTEEFFLLGVYLAIVGLALQLKSFRGAFFVVVAISAVMLSLSTLGIAASRQHYADIAKRFPFESLAGRLHRDDLSKRADPPTRMLLASEPLFRPHESIIFDRVNAIRYVHSRAVSHFLSIDGNGVGRMRHLNTRSLAYEDEPISWAEIVGSEPLVERASLDHQLPPYSPIDLATDLEAGHRDASEWFLWPQRFGLVYGPDKTAGFLAHGFTEGMPSRSDNRWAFNVRPGRRSVADDNEPYRLQKLQLIGLLYHDRPVAYDLETMPTLLNAETAPTRDLDAFESQALLKLHSGYELDHATDGRHVRAFGALRNFGDCMICHDQPEGGLLGAFSYWLEVHPPTATAGETAFSAGTIESPASVSQALAHSVSQ